MFSYEFFIKIGSDSFVGQLINASNLFFIQSENQGQEGYAVREIL